MLVKCMNELSSLVDAPISESAIRMTSEGVALCLVFGGMTLPKTDSD